MRYRLCHRLLASTVIAGALALPGVARAQEQDGAAPAQAPTAPAETAAAAPAADADAGAADNGAIVVTGSRIPQPNLTAVSPVTVVNSQDVRLQGTTKTEDLINSLPQAFGEQGGNLANGATGIATVNLRGLGPQRTLVLVNGRRLVPGDPTSAAADINMIPATLIDRVDVLTGGASSVYGSDAVAGVVNFIIDTNFEGVKLDGQYSLYQHDNRAGPEFVRAFDRRGFSYPRGNVADGGTVDLTAQIGAGFDDNRGHVVAYASYRLIRPVTQSKRDYSACTTQARTPAQIAADPANPFDCGGSVTNKDATVFLYQNGTSTAFQVGANRTLKTTIDRFNFAPTNYYQRPDERYTLGFFGNYEISESLKPYLEGMFMDDRTVAQIAQSGDFGNTYAVNCDNPLLGAQQRAVICARENLLTTPDLMGFYPGTVTAPDPDCVGPSCRTPFTFFDPGTGQPYNKGFAQIFRRNVEGGPRQDDRQHTSWRITAGLRGDLGPAWSYDAYYLYGQTNFADTYRNEFSVTRLIKALDVVAGPNGQPICRSVRTGTDPNCIPYDMWGTGTVSPAALNYLMTSGFQRAENKESVASAALTGKLGEYGLKFPWAENGIGIALGAEYRKESLDFRTDASFSLLPASDLAGQGAAAVDTAGAYDVRELFGEVRVPIVENDFFDNLSVEAGYRRSDYDLKNSGGRGFKTDTWKIGLDFAPVRDIRLRASFNRAVRAPNIVELFAPNVVALNGAGDPCSGHAIQAGERGCLLQGLHLGQIVAGNPAGQYNGLVGGNRDLRPETADTKTVGLVIQPRFLPRFALTVDWFDIKIRDAVQPIGQDTILATCVATADPALCNLVHRDAGGSLWRSSQGYVVDTPKNIGAFSTRGIDLGASYSHELGSLGGLSANFVGTWIDKFVT
ncbi:MAG TPA: TonB-dependent receptor, partial [Allosphingosinicella sp.]